MTVAIAASEIAVGGNGNVTVFTPPPGGGNSSPSSFTITAPPPLNDNFAQAINASPTPFSDTRIAPARRQNPANPPRDVPLVKALRPRAFGTHSLQQATEQSRRIPTVPLTTVCSRR